MSNPLYYLAGFVLAMGYPTGFEPLAFVRSPAAPWAALAACVLFALLSRLLLARSRRPALARLVLRGLALILYGALIYVFHFPLWIWSFGVEEGGLAGSLLILLPLFALFGILGAVSARLDPRRGGLAFAFRGFVGLSLLPILSMLLLEELFRQVEPLRRTAFVYPWIGWAASGGSMALLLALLPPLLRRVWGARPIGPGPLRERLEGICRAADFRCRELLQVGTGGSGVANAFVVGLAPLGKYVFFTDAILRGMDPAELECVLAHEIVHSKRRHILFYLVFALAFSLLTALAQEAATEAEIPAAVVIPAGLAWMAVCWGGAFGYASRRFETEADLVAARLAPAGAAGMAAALDRVASLNGVPPWAPSWRHFSIGRRIGLLARAADDPAFGAAFERNCRRLRAAALLLLCAGLAGGAAVAARQAERAPESRSVLAALDRLETARSRMAEGRHEEALAELRAGEAAGADHAVYWLWVADCERALGREAQALRAEETARRKGVADPRARLRLE